MTRVLLASDDRVTASYLTHALAANGFEIKHFSLGIDAVTEAVASVPDAVLLGPPLPDIDVLALCRWISQAYDVPVLFCSSAPSERDIVQAFEAGADDYVTMPVRSLEIVARLRAILRRAANGRHGHLPSERHMSGDVEIRIDEHQAYRKGVPIELSPIEFRLLACLVREAGRVVSHAKLLAQVWGPEYVDCRHYLRVYIRYLRAKLEDDPGDPRLILSEWGVGYRFQPGPAGRLLSR